MTRKMIIQKPVIVFVNTKLIEQYQVLEIPVYKPILKIFNGLGVRPIAALHAGALLIIGTVLIFLPFFIRYIIIVFTN